MERFVTSLRPPPRTSVLGYRLLGAQWGECVGNYALIQTQVVENFFLLYGHLNQRQRFLVVCPGIQDWPMAPAVRTCLFSVQHGLVMISG